MEWSRIQRVIERITDREENFFLKDLETHRATLAERCAGRSAIVIGGAGSIGSQFIKQLIQFKVKRLYVVDTNENGLAELVRDIRSTESGEALQIKTYPLDYSSSIFERLYFEQGPFELVANFAALKHVRSEKDEYAIQAMFENNFINAQKLLGILKQQPPEHFFCVSTDKAAAPVSVMGATKKLMEAVIFSYQEKFKVSTARFANVAFSNGSLLDSYVHRYEKGQPIVCPADIKRYFVSPEEAGLLCLLACVQGQSGDVFFPKLSPEQDLIPMRRTVEAFLQELGLEMDLCPTDEAAKQRALDRGPNDPYPVYLFDTDTSGEKHYEEFHTANDELDLDSFGALGVIKRSAAALPNAAKAIEEAQELFAEGANKAAIVDFLKRQLPDFQHVEAGRSLDEKM